MPQTVEQTSTTISKVELDSILESIVNKVGMERTMESLSYIAEVKASSVNNKVARNWWNRISRKLFCLSHEG